MVDQPDQVCEELLKVLTKRVFDEQNDVEGLVHTFDQDLVLGDREEDIDGAVEQDDARTVVESPASFSTILAQLLFFVGHVAIKQIVHLENIEAEWKRRKMTRDAVNGGAKAGELEMVRSAH